MRDLNYKAIAIRNYTHIYLNNVICTDREIRKKNQFISVAEAQEWINDELNQIKTIVTSNKALNNLKVKK